MPNYSGVVKLQISAGQHANYSGIIQLVIKSQSQKTTGTVQLIISPRTTTPPSGNYSGIVQLIISPVSVGGGNGKNIQPSIKCVEPTGSINPFDWLSYWGCILGSELDQLNSFIGNIGTDISKGLWSTLPDWFKKWITDFTTAIGQWSDILKDPFAFLQSVVQSVTKESSPSLQQQLLQAMAHVNQNIQTDLLSVLPKPQTETDPILGPAYNLGKAIGERISTPTDPNSVVGRINELDTMVSQVFLGLWSGQIVIENIPFLNKTGSAQFILGYMEARGILSVIRGTLQPYLDANINRNLNYKLNEQYENVLRDLGTLISLRLKGYLSDDAFILEARQVSGLSRDKLMQMKQGALQVPTLEDFVTYNLRHPQDTFDLKAVGDVTGLDFDRYYKVFEERIYADLGIRQLQTAFDVLDLSEDKIREILRLARIDPRVNSVLGISPLDLFTQVIMEKKGLTEGIKALGQKEKNYLAGLIDYPEIESFTRQVLASPKAQDYYLTYVKDAKALVDKKAQDKADAAAAKAAAKPT